MKSPEGPFDITLHPYTSSRLATLRGMAEATLIRRTRIARCLDWAPWLLALLAVATAAGLTSGVVILHKLMQPASRGAWVSDLLAATTIFGALFLFLWLGASAALKGVLDRVAHAPVSRTAALLERLTELERVRPEACIEFVEMCESDETVRAFQHELAEMGRKPVYGEYEAALLWSAGADWRAEQRQRQERVNQACARLAAPIRI